MIGAIFMKFGLAPATIVILIEVYTELKSFHQEKVGNMFMMYAFNIIMPYIIHCKDILGMVVANLKQGRELSVNSWGHREAS